MTDVSQVLEHDAEGHEHTRPDADWKLGENAHPILDRVFVQRDEPEVHYAGTSIQVPDKHKWKSPWCTVIATGPQVTEVAKGDRVVVHTWAGEPVHQDEYARLFVVTEGDIEAVAG